jgi:hypothetical protein
MFWRSKIKKVNIIKNNISYKKANIFVTFGMVLIIILCLVDKKIAFGNMLTRTNNELTKLYATLHPTPFPMLPYTTTAPSESPSEAPTLPSPIPQVNISISPAASFACTGPHSGQTIMVTSNSICQNDYTDCGFTDGTWKIMTKTECTTEQNNQNEQNNSNTNDDSSNYNVPTPIPGIPLVSCQTSTGTYQLTQSECTQAQSKDAQLVQQEQQAQATQEQNTKEIEDQEYASCYGNVDKNYQIQYQNCTTSPLAENGEYPAFCQQQVQQQAQQAMNECNTEYPNR